MEKITPTKQALLDCGFEIEEKKKKDRTYVTFNGTLGTVLKAMKASDTPEKGLSGHFRDHLANDSEKDFKGGTSAKLRRNLEGDIDMSNFHTVRAALEGTELMRKLRTKLAESGQKRKRVMSEHDGEWAYDRRWEISPFAATKKAPQTNRVIDVDIHFSISAWAKASEIDKFGALAWALCDVIETAGVRTKVRWINEVEHCASGASIDGEINILLKKPGEYLAPNMLATVLQANFFRRPGFSMIGALAESQGYTPAYGLGSPVSHPAIEFKDGKLTLGPSVTRGYDAQIEEAILRAIA